MTTLNRDLTGISDFIANEVTERSPNKSPLKEELKKRSTVNFEKKYDDEHKLDDSDIYPSRDTNNYQEKKDKNTTRTQKRPGSAIGHTHTYGTVKRTTRVAGDVTDFCYDLAKENLSLKEKENLLEREIMKMMTKLRRIEELARSGRHYSDLDFSKIQNELEDQFNEIKDENTMLKERVRKLKTIHNGLSSKSKTGVSSSSTINKRPSSKPKFQASKTQTSGFGKNNKVMPQSTGSVINLKPMSQTSYPHEKLADQLREQLVKNEKELIKLRTESDRLSQSQSGAFGQDQILHKIRQHDDQLREISRGLDDVQDSYHSKEKIFKESKTLMEEILKQIREARINNETLKQKNMRLQIQGGSTKDLSEALSMHEAERDGLEQSIKHITSGSFFKRDSGQSTLKRMADLEDKIKEKEKIAKDLREQEAKKTTEFNAIKSTVEKLTGERDYLKGENEKLRGKYTEDNMSDFNIHKTLFKMDPHKYGQAISDMAPSADNIPIWANLNFLDRGQEQFDPNNVSALKHEILKIKHENKDFAAELEKAQNLLKLQRDIERDNTQYYTAELKRLELLSKSAAMKAEELARRADEKARQISEINKKLGLSISRGNSPAKQQMSQTHLDNLETQSEFSVMTNESSLNKDENILDFVVQDAEYQYEAFRQVLDEREMLLHQRTLITFVTVDFYNHDTETSQIAEGFKPLYNTQFSFKNKVDDFYVQFLQKQTLKLDFYISKNNAAIHVGHAEVSLREIVEREMSVPDATAKTPVIQKILSIYPVGGRSQGTQPLGTIRFKIRMRQAISEAMRYYRDRNELYNITSQQHVQDIDNKSRQKMVTVQIVGAKDIKVKYSNVASIAPFFYYQFYTFDERYSATSQGQNPNFDDTFSYKITFDGKFTNYIKNEVLEVILFDDNAPITGVERGGKALQEADQNEDMIGIAKIPLQDLLKGGSVHNLFPIRNLKKEKCGELEVKVTIVDLEIGFDMTSTKRNMNQNLPYNKQWENEIVYKIAQKLCKFPTDVDMIFGIFSRGQKTVSKEDFKYCVLQRLNLRNEISEREIDMFLRSCTYLVDKEYMTKDDFVMIFQASITQARHEQQSEEAVQQQTIRKFEDMQKSLQHQQQMFQQSKTGNAFDDFQRTHDPLQTFNFSPTKLSFHEQEVLDILTKCRTHGNIDALKEKVMIQQQNDYIESKFLYSLLVRDGGLSESDAAKITQFLEFNQKVQVTKLLDILSQSHSYSSLKSQALVKFNKLIQTQGEKFAQKLLELDHNKDGQLIYDGLLAGLFTPGFGFSDVNEVHEIFQIVQKGGEFSYKEYLLSQNPSLRLILSKVNNTSSPNINNRGTLGTIQETQNKDFTSITNSHSFSQSSMPTEDPKIKLVRQKFKQFVKQQELTLASLFKLMDTDSDQVLTLTEFMQKIRVLDVKLDEEEIKILYKLLDKTGSGGITYKQFVLEFPEINISYMIKKIRSINDGSGTPIQHVFEQYCSDKGKTRMTYIDFKKFVKFYYAKAEDHEIDSLYKHFDSSMNGHITIDEFKGAFGREVKEQVFKISIEDIIKPLATKVAKFNVNVATLFEKYDANHNGKLSAEELSKALHTDFKIALTDDEVLVIKEYFINKHHSSEIKKIDFVDLLQTKFKREFDEPKAKQALQSLKQKLGTISATPQSILQPFDQERINRLTLRNFKVAINALNTLNQYAIDNLTKYLDKDNDGFIGINIFDKAIKDVVLTHSMSQSFSSTGRRTNKWGK